MPPSDFRVVWGFALRSSVADAEALTNTLLIAERCAAFDLTEDLGYEFPDFEGSARGGALESLATMCLAKIWMRRTKMWTP